MEFSNYTDRAETNFKAECPDCGMECESRNHRDVVTFASMHNEHTGHEAEWVELDFDGKFELNPEEWWNVWCEVCGEDWDFQTREVAESFEEDHETYTNHVADGVEKHTDGKLATDTVKGVVSELDMKFGLYHGVPFSAIATIFEKEGYSRVRLREWLEELEEENEIYEAGSDCFRPRDPQMDEFDS